MGERLETGSYILRSLIANVALNVEGESQGVSITCVELYDEHLYVGTSAGEILHHMRFPPDPSDPSGQPSYILASRLKPPVNQPGDAGIQQILLLPSVSKACVVSNGTLSFYSLPELSPAFPRVNPLTCGWVGGVDLDANQDELQDGVVVMLCLRGKIRLVKVGEEPLILRNIEFRGCLSIVRRGNFACLADARSYALLDVAQQQKIPLPSISSVDNQPAENAGNVPDDVWTTGSGNISRSLSPAEGFRMQEERGHRKTSSLGIFRKDNDSPGPSHLKPSSSQRHGFDSPALRRTSLGSRRVSTPDIASDIQKAELGKPLPPPPPTDSGSRTGSPAPNKDFIPLKPLIASPTAQEFLLVTGTAPNEPSLGVFVNLDGEVDRGTIEFPSYPESLVVDDKGFDMTNSQTIEEVPEEGHVLAVVQRDVSGRTVLDVQIQRYPGEGAGAKEWLGVSAMHESSSGTGNEQIGIRAIPHKAEVGVPEITEKLALKPIHIDLDDGNESKTLDDSTNRREKEEKDCIQRLCQVEARLTLWRGDEVFWLIRNPTVLRLDSRLRLAQATSVQRDAPIAPQRELIERIFNDIRDVRSATELEFLSLSYIRQKAATLLFMDLLIRTISGTIVFEHEKQYTERTLIESELDPRIVLAFLPTIREEILQGEGGIWLQGGLKEIVESFMAQKDMAVMPTDPNGPFGDNLLQVVKRFLLYWRRKKGNPSVKDGAQVFPTVDAALLHILLLLDSQSPPGPATAGSLRAELYAVVDNGVEGNERAIALLEGFKRLYVLSRHYGKRKMPTMVLQTWKRIISGEEDTGGEFIDGEMELRKYLSKLRDRTLVVEYGTWLAARNPKLGVQVFADENSKVVIPASEALAILREKAPNAVKEYLEYLVFGKKQSQHINELIAYYLDIVLSKLKDSPESRSFLSQTYETYRALRPPKPTYRQFITDNGIDSEWWHSRLRLLHLLGSSQGPASSYNVLKILTRLEPYVDELVPEMIILNGRQGRHKEALHLLTHGLGDFDTAISYCLLGGSSIYRPATGFVPQDSLPSKEEQAILFKYLLHEFLAIEDMNDRIERTGELLERFGGWFDAAYVLSLLPDSSSIEMFSAFLINALQRLVRERSETVIVKALSGAENLKTSEQFIEKAKEVGPIMDHGQGIT